MIGVSDDIADIILRSIGPDGVTIEAILARAAHAGCPSENRVRMIVHRLVIGGKIHQDGIIYYPVEQPSEDLYQGAAPLTVSPIVHITITSAIKPAAISAHERTILRAMDSLLKKKLIRITAEGNLAANYLS